MMGRSRAEHNYDHSGYCDETGKRKYPSAKAVRVIMRKAGNRIRPYLCQHCQAWHATSQNDLSGDFNRPRRKRRIK